MCYTITDAHTNIHMSTPAAAAAAAAAAIFAALPLLWNGLVGAAAGAATNGLVDWAVGEKYQVTKREYRM